MALDIASIKAKHAATQASAKAAKDAKDARARADADLVNRVGAEWPVVWNTIQLLVHSLDSELNDSGLSLSTTTIDRHDQGELARVEIELKGTAKEKRLILNVGMRGRIRPVLLIPHSGPSREAFELTEADTPRLKEEILFFLDVAVGRE